MAVKRFRCVCKWPFHWTAERYPASLVPAWQVGALSLFNYLLSIFVSPCNCAVKMLICSYLISPDSLSIYCMLIEVS